MGTATLKDLAEANRALEAAGLPTAAPATFEPVALADFAGGTVAEPRWAVERVWPEDAMGVIAGRPKDGKSTLAVELAVSLWSGTHMFGLPEFPVRSRPAPVLYVQQENANDRVQRDLQAVLAARELGILEREHEYEQDGTVALTIDTFELDASEAFLHLDAEPAFEVLSHAGLDLSVAAHRDWLWSHVAGRGFRYVFLDPLYMLIGVVDEKDSAQLKPILVWLTRMKNELGCAPIVTHHMSDKGGSNEAATMLGTTYIHGWYEAALLTRRGAGSVFHVNTDALRGIGTTGQIVLSGLGVGSWGYAQAAQNQKDSLGRNAPRTAEKEARKQQLRLLRASNPTWSYEELGDAMGGLSKSTVAGYVKEMADEEGGG